MVLSGSGSRRRGAVLPIVAACMVVMLGFVALAVDIGMVAVARTQCQNAADSAAMAGARALNGNTATNYNTGGAPGTALAAAASNTIQSKPVTGSQVTIQIGSYTYNTALTQFQSNIPAASNDTPNLVKSTVTMAGKNLFGRMLGSGTFNTSATATAVHRPRDVAIILDLSGSMRFDSLLGIPYAGSRAQSNNPETVYPLFGHYSSASLMLQNAVGPDVIAGNTYGLANISTSSNSGNPIVGDFYQNNLGASPIGAFAAASNSYATTPAGDKPLVKYHTSSYATNLLDVTNSTSTPFLGYTLIPFLGYTGPLVPEFSGYTLGPSYWGKTFFIWPPDPGTMAGHYDWRQKFFGTTNNTKLWNSSGAWQAPGSSTYTINYSAILAWITQAPNPFPPQLRAGRILYYSQIPTSINTSSYPVSDPNQRFWKEYIDHTLGLYQTGQNSYDVITPMTGYGDDFQWGSVKISPYMNYQDNPLRPQTHFWFGPMSMLDFLGNYNLWVQYPNWNPYWPGNCHEGPLWACKLGVQAAMVDIQNNHPNDFVSLMFFNTPEYSQGDGGSFNRTRVPLGRSYQRLSDTLWFPPTTINTPGTEISMYDATNNLDVPRAYGGTTTVMGFMQAFNQFSGNQSLVTYAPAPAPAGEAGGYGRKGAQRLVILQTDGMANNLAAAPFTNAGAYNSYYNIRQPGEYPSFSGPSVTSQINTVVSQICALDSANPPGYGTTRKPVLVHCMALGPIFDPSTNSPNYGPALALLQQIQYLGNTQSSPSTALAPYKIITGTPTQRTALIQQAFSTIMQDGVQVSLIQ